MTNKLYSIVTNKVSGNNYMADEEGKVIVRFEVDDITKTISFNSMLLEENEICTILRTVKYSRKYKDYIINYI